MILASGLRLSREPTLVWDNRIALLGAFGEQSGVVAAGTGSVVYGLTEAGREFRSTDFGHDTGAAAWGLSSGVLRRLAEGDVADGDFVQEFLVALPLADLTAARAALNRRFVGVDLGAGAPVVTDGAERGVPMAVSVCTAAVDGLAQGVRLLTLHFAHRPVPVAPVGSVARSRYIRRELARALATDRAAVFTDGLYPPLVGAVVLASREAGRPLAPAVARALAARMSDSGAGN